MYLPDGKPLPACRFVRIPATGRVSLLLVYGRRHTKKKRKVLSGTCVKKSHLNSKCTARHSKQWSGLEQVATRCGTLNFLVAKRLPGSSALVGVYEQEKNEAVAVQQKLLSQGVSRLEEKSSSQPPPRPSPVRPFWLTKGCCRDAGQAPQVSEQRKYGGVSVEGAIAHRELRGF